MTASVVSSLTTTTAEWAASYTVINGTTVPATAITTVLQCDLCGYPEEQQQQEHQTTNTCLLDTAVQQTAGGGSGDDGNNDCGSASAIVAEAMATMTGVASPSPQEKWWGGSLLTDEGSLASETSAVEEQSSAKPHPTAATAALWGNLAILSGAMTVAVGVILWQ